MQKTLLALLKPFILYLIVMSPAAYSYAQCTVQGIKIHAFLADPNGTNNFDTDQDGSADTEDEFVQICNTTASSVTLTGFTLSDNSTVGYSFTAGDAIAAGQCITIIRQWQNTVTTIPTNFREMGAGGGFFNNNGGDDIVLNDGSTSCTVTYPSTSYPEQDGCVTVIGTTSGAIDCSLTPADLTASPIPVELTSFTAAQSDLFVELNWTTASELNNSHFEIERSEDGENFEQIGIVSGEGNSSQLRNYSYLDYHRSNAPFYRLKQVDFDGVFEYSEVVKVSSERDGSASFIQNRDDFIITAYEDVSVMVSNANGQIIFNEKLTSGSKVSKSQFGKGFHVIQVISAFGQETIKWVNL